MSITSPPTAVEGELLVQLVGVGMSLTEPVELVATNGTETLRITQDIAAGRTSSLIKVNVGVGLAASILAPQLGHDGIPLTDTQWALKWVVGTDELGVVVSAPPNYQQREVDNAEKFGGILAGVTFGTQDQLVSFIITGANTIKQTESNGKATGSFDGTERVVSETITHFLFFAQTGLWRARDEVITPFSLGLWFDGESWVDGEPWID